MSGRLPRVIDVEPIMSAKIIMDNKTEYTITKDDMVAIQYINDRRQIVVRKGKIKDIVLIKNRPRPIEHSIDHWHKEFIDKSRIILDCSEQFSVNLLEIKLSDIINIGSIESEFDDYSDRKTEIDHIDPEDTMPIRQKD